MVNRDLFQIVTVEDGQKDADAIMKVFNEIHRGVIPCDVKLLNYYREVPVSFNASISNVMPDRIEMSVHQNQAVVMKHEKQTLIKCEYVPNGLGAQAFVALSNIDRCRVILTRFAYAQIKAERRGAVRVEIDFPLEGTFASTKGTFTGNLGDISVTGASLKLPSKPTADTDVAGRFTCQLPGGRLEVPARLLKFVDTENGARAIVTLNSDSNVERLISQFIFSIQVEIIRELKEQYT